MNKYTINVPKGIRYLSDWSEFNFSNFQNQHVIINKQITGCGFTEYALRCNYPIVLCSPRKMLMENKKKQHGDRVFLVINQDLDKIETDVDFDPTEKLETASIRARKKYEGDLKELGEYQFKQESIYQRIKNELYNYLQSLPLELSPKIIVTYDSTYIIKKILEEWNLLSQYYFIVDEFQAILDDSRFKASTELEFMNILNSIPSTVFVSATPMLDKYLKMIDEFKNLDYYQLDWGKLDPDRIQKPTLKIRGFRSLIGTMRNIIQTYLNGSFEKVVVERGGQLVEVESREAVFYVNSVNHIIRIIKDMGLTPGQVNILCSNTEYNQERINKKLGKDSGFIIGDIPTYGEPHKMFTFCTRTVYLGADFYSLCARSFIFSDSNADCLSIDISMDLPQILGRQRLEENPWRNSAEFYYRSTCDYRKMTEEKLLEMIKEKEISSNNLLEAFATAPEHTKYDVALRYLFSTNANKYRLDYIAVDKKSDKILQPCFNNLVKVNELRTFEIQQIDYADRFTVITSIENQFGGISEMRNECVIQFFKDYDRLKTYLDRLSYLCEWLISHPETIEYIIENIPETDKIRQQVLTLGPERIKSLGYNVTRIKEAMGITIFDQSILEREIYSRFNIGDRLTKAEIKNTLRVIYDEVGYKKTPKANDLESWFEVKSTQITNKVTGKRDMGFEIIKQK